MLAAKQLERQSDFILKEAFETHTAVFKTESGESIAKQINSLKELCRKSWEGLNEVLLNFSDPSG